MQAKPDLGHVSFCVSLIIHDLIADAEARNTEAPTAPNAPPVGNTFGLFQPRDIFTLPGKRSRDAFEGTVEAKPEETQAAAIPSEEDIRSSIAEIYALSRFTPACLVVAVIYMERLRRSAGARLLASTWQPTLLITIIVAQKVWEDRSHMNVDFTRLNVQLTLQQINQLERDFLRLIDFNVGVKAAVYTDWYFRLASLCERTSTRLRPVDGHEARALEISTNTYAEQMHKLENTKPHSGPLPEGNHDETPRSRLVLS